MVLGNAIKRLKSDLRLKGAESEFRGTKVSKLTAVRKEKPGTWCPEEAGTA